MAGIGRISTFGLHQTTLRNASLTQERLADLQSQLSGGFKSRTYAGIANQAERLLNLEDRLSRIDLYKGNNEVILTRVETTTAVLGQTIETVADLKNLIIQRRNDSQADSLAFPEQLDGLWKSLSSQLNTTLEGRYIFSGTKTDTPAVDTANFPSLNSAGETTNAYYQGSNRDTTVRVDDNISITYNIRANDPAFQKVFAALAVAQQGDISNNDEDLARAFDLAEQGLEEIISVQAKANSNKISIEQVVERQTSLGFFWQGLRDEIRNTDLVSVSTQVAINEAVLQASFQSFSRINALRLSDFLR